MFLRCLYVRVTFYQSFAVGRTIGVGDFFLNCWRYGNQGLGLSMD